MYEGYKMVGGTSCGLGVGGCGVTAGVPLVFDCVRLWVYECCKMVGGTSLGYGVGGWEAGGPFSV